MVVRSGPDLQAVLDELSNEIDWLVRWSYLLTLRACKTCPPLELAEQARLVRRRLALRQACVNHAPAEG